MNHSRLLILIIDHRLEFVHINWINWLNFIMLIFTDEINLISKLYGHLSNFLSANGWIKCDWLYLPLRRLFFKKKNGTKIQFSISKCKHSLSIDKLNLNLSMFVIIDGFLIAWNFELENYRLIFNGCNLKWYFTKERIQVIRLILLFNNSNIFRLISIRMEWSCSYD